MPTRGNVTPQTGPCGRAAERRPLFLNFPRNRISVSACLLALRIPLRALLRTQGAGAKGV